MRLTQITVTSTKPTITTNDDAVFTTTVYQPLVCLNITLFCCPSTETCHVSPTAFNLLRACPAASVDGLYVSAERPRISIISSPRHRHLQGVNHEGGKQGSRLVLAEVLATDHLQGSLGGQPLLGVSRAGGTPFSAYRMRVMCRRLSDASGCPRED